ncbi:MAG TPA: N,N-dimethylformamidase beta subunit family domain-containing protein, partial [Solirubrobacterales bacterium]|nr:N,N-dimethylformamidase beta subunit family domain-containing protein [Solirubrobacterales bacterium]
GLWGYTDRLSYRPGEEVRFHVSTSASRYSIEIARVGARRDVVWTRSGLPGSLHPTPDEAFARGCGWPDGFAFRIPREWRSGYYAVTLRADGARGEALGPEERSAAALAHSPARGGTITLSARGSTRSLAGRSVRCSPSA